MIPCLTTKAECTSSQGWSGGLTIINNNYFCCVGGYSMDWGLNSQCTCRRTHEGSYIGRFLSVACLSISFFESALAQLGCDLSYCQHFNCVQRYNYKVLLQTIKYALRSPIIVLIPFQCLRLKEFWMYVFSLPNCWTHLVLKKNALAMPDLQSSGSWKFCLWEVYNFVFPMDTLWYDMTSSTCPTLRVLSGITWCHQFWYS